MLNLQIKTHKHSLLCCTSVTTNKIADLRLAVKFRVNCSLHIMRGSAALCSLCSIAGVAKGFTRLWVLSDLVSCLPSVWYQTSNVMEY